MDNLEIIRKQIDGIDAQLAGLFEQRMECAREIASYKAAHGLSVVDPAREEETVRQGAMRVMDRDIREYYVRFEQHVISLSRDWQERLMNGVKVAYSGVPGAFAHIAVMRLFPGAQPVPYPDFTAAYRACETGDCDVAVLPFENSSAGEVAAVLEGLSEIRPVVGRIELVEGYFLAAELAGRAGAGVVVATAAGTAGHHAPDDERKDDDDQERAPQQAGLDQPVEFGNHHGHGVVLSLYMAIARRAGWADRRQSGGEDTPPRPPLQAQNGGGAN